MQVVETEVLAVEQEEEMVAAVALEIVVPVGNQEEKSNANLQL